MSIAFYTPSLALESGITLILYILHKGCYMETKFGKTVVIAPNSSDNSAENFSAYNKRHIED